MNHQNIMQLYIKHTMNNREVIVVAGMRTYVCPRCKVRDQTIEEKQTRSLDESSTIKCVCNNCGKKWNGN
jgi:DNA-directed RNA polymerase subunit M/transcription elongation factor TFIIS